MSPEDEHRRQLALNSLNELRYLTTCRCRDDWTRRGRHEPGCASDYREDVNVVAYALGFGE